MSEAEDARDYYVYLLLDPRVASNDVRDKAFYVGKGKGRRARQHVKDHTDSDKTRRIREIIDAGDDYEVYYVAFKNEERMTEQQALQIEASLIWALQPNLTNAVKGQHFGIVSDRAQQVTRMTQNVVLDPNQRCVLVWTNGIRGGHDHAGEFLGATPEDVWENGHGYWYFGQQKLDKFDGWIEQQKTVALIVLTNGRRSASNIVAGVFQVTGWGRSNGKVFFRGVDKEPKKIRTLRKRLLNNSLLVDGEMLINPNYRGYAPEGTRKMPKMLPAE